MNRSWSQAEVEQGHHGPMWACALRGARDEAAELRSMPGEMAAGPGVAAAHLDS